MTFHRLILALLATLLVSGCASEYPRVDATWGHAVTGMVRAETLYPKHSAHPPALAPSLGDGERLENVIKAHRKDVPVGVTSSVSTGQFQAGSQ